jgi:hypothetical protein
VALQERIAGEWEGRNTWMTYDTSFLKTLTVSFFDDDTQQKFEAERMALVERISKLEANRDNHPGARQRQ